MVSNWELNQNEDLLNEESLAKEGDLKKVKTEDITTSWILSKIKLKIKTITSKNEKIPVKVKVPVLVAETPSVKVNVPLPVLKETLPPVSAPGEEETFIVKEIRWKLDFDQSKLIEDKLKDMKSYIKTEQDLNDALSNLMVRTLRNIWSSQQLGMLLSDMWMTNYAEDEVDKFYSLLSKWDIDGKWLLSRSEGKIFQSLLAKMSDKIKNVLDENGGIDWLIWKKSLEAISIFSEALYKSYPKLTPLKSIDNLLVKRMIKRSWEENELENLEIDKIDNSVDYENLVPIKPQEIKEIWKRRIELHTSYDFSKLEGNAAANVFAMFYEQISYDNLDPSILYDWDAKVFILKGRDEKGEIRYDDVQKTLWIYGDAGSLFLKDPFKGSVLEWSMDVTRYENRPNWEPRKITINSSKDIENIKTWKWDTFHNFNIQKINLLGWAINISWNININDAKTVSNGIEKDFKWFDDWYNKLWELKTKDDFTNWYSDGKKYLDMIGQANTEYGKNIDYKNINIVFDPYKFSKLFESTGIFKDPLAAVQWLTGAIWPISMNGEEIKEVVGLIWVSIDTEKYDSIITDKASRRLVDILVNKTTASKNMDDLINKSLSQAQFQLDNQKTLTVKEWMYNMMKNGEDVVLLWEIGENKTGMALVRLNSIENEKTWLFAFVEHSQNDVYVTPFKNYYNKASVWIQNVNSTSAWVWINQKIYATDGFKISWEAIAKYMNISGVNSKNLILNVPSGELPIGEIAQNLWYKWDEVASINKINGYVWVRLEKEGANYWINASVGLTWAVQWALTDTFKMEYASWVKPLLDVNAFLQPREDITLQWNVTTDFKNNTFGKISAEKQFNDKFAAWLFVNNDWTTPIDQNNELKYNRMNSKNSIWGWAYGKFTPNNTTEVSAAVTNTWVNVHAQKKIDIRGADVTWFVEASADYKNPSPTVWAWVRIGLGGGKKRK